MISSVNNEQLTEGFHQGGLVVVGMKNYNLSTKLNIYPNPTSSELHIQHEQHQGEWQVVIIDTQGKHLLKKSFSQPEVTIGVSSFAVGSYVLKVFQEDQLIGNSRFIKTN